MKDASTCPPTKYHALVASAVSIPLILSKPFIDTFSGYSDQHSIPNPYPLPNNANRVITISQQQLPHSMERTKQAFKAEYFNEEENQRYNLSRHYLGSRIAGVLALYNLFVLRQKILKNAIYLTKTTNPTIVKVASFGVGVCYLVGLFAVWLVPSFAVESAVRTYYGCQSATMAYMLPGQEIAQRVFNEARRRDLLKRQNIGVGLQQP